MQIDSPFADSFPFFFATFPATGFLVDPFERPARVLTMMLLIVDKQQQEMKNDFWVDCWFFCDQNNHELKQYCGMQKMGIIV